MRILRLEFAFNKKTHWFTMVLNLIFFLTWWAAATGVLFDYHSAVFQNPSQLGPDLPWYLGPEDPLK